MLLFFLSLEIKDKAAGIERVRQTPKGISLNFFVGGEQFQFNDI